MNIFPFKQLTDSAVEGVIGLTLTTGMTIIGKPKTDPNESRELVLINPIQVIHTQNGFALAPAFPTGNDQTDAFIQCQYIAAFFSPHAAMATQYLKIIGEKVVETPSFAPRILHS